MFPVFLATRCLVRSDSLRGISLAEMRPRNFVFHTLCYLSVISHTVLDHLIGIRLEALQSYYVLVLWMLPSRTG